MKAMLAGFIGVLALVLVFSADGAGEKEPQYKIKEVMQKAMKGGLCKKVATGKATAAEKKQLVEMFVALHSNTPPKGDEKVWAKVTQALVETAKKIESGTDETATMTLGKLANCANCHKQFKK